MPRFCVLALLALAACGAEGVPQATPVQPASGISISGTASLGVAVNN